jgi:hypothetical protein
MRKKPAKISRYYTLTPERFDASTLNETTVADGFHVTVTQIWSKDRNQQPCFFAEKNSVKGAGNGEQIAAGLYVKIEQHKNATSGVKKSVVKIQQLNGKKFGYVLCGTKDSAKVIY